MTSRPLRILLGDLAYETEGNRHNLYVPLNVGYIAAATKARFGRAVEVRITKSAREMIDLAGSWQPQLAGLASYYWNDRLNYAVGSRIGRRIPIILGGPSIDSDREALEAYARARPWAAGFITNEGEDAFAAIVEKYVGTDSTDVPPGAMFRSMNQYAEDAWFDHGKPGGLSTDLAAVPSPYLDGTLDAFLEAGLPYQPLVQTSRLCPYTCSFCVSGKNRGKLRAFPLDQVREEVDHVAARFADRPDHVLYVVDENFGILERDMEVAEMIKQARSRAGYPRRLFYYNDKRFTGVSQKLHEAVGDMCWHGVMLSQQSENPETLKAIKRRNLPDERIAEIIAWAKERGLKTSTELIFGLPMETLESFLALLDKCARLGFDAIQCYNLIVFDGIEMNRPAYREEHRLQTDRRLIADSWTVLDGEGIVESEEVVTATSSFGWNDYLLVRQLNVIFHAVFVLGFEREFFRGLVEDGWSLTAVARRFLDLDVMELDLTSGCTAPSAWKRGLVCAIADELYSTEMVGQLAEKVGREGESAVPKVVKIQPHFAGLLARSSWAPAAFCDALGEVKAAQGARPVQGGSNDDDQDQAARDQMVRLQA